MTICTKCDEPIHGYAVVCRKHGLMHSMCTPERSGLGGGDYCPWCGVELATVELEDAPKPARYDVRDHVYTKIGPLHVRYQIVEYMLRDGGDDARHRMRSWTPTFEIKVFDFLDSPNQLRTLAEARVAAGDHFWRDAISNS